MLFMFSYIVFSVFKIFYTNYSVILTCLQLFLYRSGRTRVEFVMENL